MNEDRLLLGVSIGISMATIALNVVWFLVKATRS